jgi:hypothetical protein
VQLSKFNKVFYFYLILLKVYGREPIDSLLDYRWGENGPWKKSFLSVWVCTVWQFWDLEMPAGQANRRSPQFKSSVLPSRW